jgi:hypothetical protein
MPFDTSTKLIIKISNLEARTLKKKAFFCLLIQNKVKHFQLIQAVHPNSYFDTKRGLNSTA